MSADEFVNTAEEQILHHCTYEDLNWDKFKRFYENTYKEPCEWEDRDWIFENLRLGKGGKPNLAAALLFTDKPDKTLTGFFITAIWFWGNDLHEQEYRSSDNFKGNIAEQSQQAHGFSTSRSSNQESSKAILLSSPNKPTPLYMRL